MSTTSFIVKNPEEPLSDEKSSTARRALDRLKKVSEGERPEGRLPERRASTMPMFGKPSAVGEFFGGFMGAPRRFSVMDPEAKELQSARDLGEQASVAAELYGALSPFAVASTVAKSGQMMGVSPLTVFQGSPHRFTKLDSKKIGTGEGTQVYGYGLYFAENPKVAKTYAYPERFYKRLTGNLSPLQEKISDAMDQGVDANTLFSQLSAMGYKVPKKEFATPYDALLDEWQNVKNIDPTGSFYKIDLPDQMIDRMIDWDKPLREQSKAIQDLAKQFNLSLDDLGGDLVFRSGAKKRKGAELLRQAGIPGVKYLDRGSRGTGKGTRNFVVFPGEEEAMTVLDVKAKGGEVSTNDFIKDNARSSEVPEVDERGRVVDEQEDIASESKRMLNRVLANAVQREADFFGKQSPRRLLSQLYPGRVQTGAQVTRPSEVLKSFGSGVLGLDTGKGTEAYRTGQAVANMPPVKAAAALPKVAGEAASSLAALPALSGAVRPLGSLFLTRRGQNPDWVGKLLDDGVRNAQEVLADMTHSTDRAALMEDFWNTKAANYFAKQFGTENDPVYHGIRDQTIKSPLFEKELNFPKYILDQLPVGKTKLNPETGESRFFPKYPEAYDVMRKRYDDFTRIRGAVPVRDPASVMDPNYIYNPSRQGEDFMEALRNQEIDKMIAQGTPVSQANPKLDFLTRSVKDPKQIVGPFHARSMLENYEAATGTRLGDPGFQGVAQPTLLPQNLRTAFDKGEIMYNTESPLSPLTQLFDTRSINEYLATVPERELKNLRFEDAVKGGAKVFAKRLERETMVADIRAGKNVPDKFFSEGVSAPLVQFQEGPFAGFAWKRLEKADATVPEGAYVGHSVGGYAKGGRYGPEMHRQFNEGLMRVYSLRDNRNRPVNTIEVRMEDNGPVVTQIKGNGRATGNVAPEKYDQAVMQFLQDYLKPVQIQENDKLLTPLLQSYKQALRFTPSQP